MGIVALLSPARVTSYFGLHELTSAMRNEVRAVYGGFGIAISIVLLLATQQPELRDGIVVTVGIALLGMAGGRIIGFCIERAAPLYPMLFFFVELGLSASLLLPLCDSVGWR